LERAEDGFELYNVGAIFSQKEFLELKEG